MQTEAYETARIIETIARDRYLKLMTPSWTAAVNAGISNPNCTNSVFGILPHEMFSFGKHGWF